MLKTRILIALSALCVTNVGQAQSGNAEPKRPPLYANADTNDARAYYNYGLEQLRRDPAAAANGFYWSARLDPLSADALYARRVALLLTDKRRLVRYWRGERSTLKRPDMMSIDSLYFRSLMLNPFFYEKLERVLQDAVIQEIVSSQSMASGVPASEMEFEIQAYLMRAGPGEKAFRAYTAGQFEEALRHYAAAIKESKYKHYYRNMRGRLFFQVGEIDSALTELTKAVEELRKRDAKDLVYVYESKALLEHSAGLAHERLGGAAAAKEAYGRALQEDLAYAPAHVRLAWMAIESKDTTTALSEFDLAVQLHPEDVSLRYQYGFLLNETQKNEEAETQLKKALELNPWYAPPHYVLGRLNERLGKAPEALLAYRAFLVFGSRVDPRRAEVTQRIQTLAPK